MKIIVFLLCLTAIYAENESYLKEEDFLKITDSLYQRKFYDEAIEEYNSFLKEYPKTTHKKTIYQKLIYCYFVQKKYDLALQNYDLYLALEKDKEKHNSSLLKKGELLLLMKKYKESITLFSSLIDQKHNVLLCHYYLAKAYNELKNIPKENLSLLYIYKNCKFKDKRFINSCLKYATNLFNKNEFEESKLILQDLLTKVKEKSFVAQIDYFLGKNLLFLKDYKTAIIHLSNYLSQANHKTYKNDAVLTLAENYVYLSNIKQVFATLKLLENPSSVEKDRKSFLLAWVYFNNNQYLETIKYCDEIKAKSNMYKDSLVLKINSYFQQKKYQKVIDESNIYLAKYTDNLNKIRYFNAKSCSLLNNHLDEAILLLQKNILKKNKYFYPSMTLLADIYTKQGDKDKSFAIWQKLSSDSNFDNYDIALLNSIQYARDSKKWQLLEAFCHKFIQKFPANSNYEDIVKLYITSLHQQKKYSLMEKFVTDFYTKNKNIDVLGMFYSFLYEQKKFDKILSLSAKFPEKKLNVYKASIFLKQNKAKEAYKILAEFFEDSSNKVDFFTIETQWKIASKLNELSYNKAALNLLKSLSDNDKYKKTAKLKIATIYLEQGLLVEVDKILAEFNAKDFANDATSLYKLNSLKGFQLFLQDKDQQAMSLLEDNLKNAFYNTKKVKIDTKDKIRVRYTRALLYQKTNDLAKAKKELNVAIYTFQDKYYSPRCILLMVDVYFKLQQKNKALFLLKELKDKWSEFFASKEVTLILQRYSLVRNEI